MEYYSERRRTVQPVPQIEAEQPIATEGDIPRLNQVCYELFDNVKIIIVNFSFINK